jgi:hypothetical protein
MLTASLSHVNYSSHIVFPLFFVLHNTIIPHPIAAVNATAAMALYVIAYYS